MKINIRKTLESDLKGIYELYNGKKSMEEIMWALKEFEGRGYRSFIATDEKSNIIGHIGYLISTYTFKNSNFRGLHNMMWVVDPSIKGGAGLKLFAENIKMADFGFAIGASKFTKALFPLINYKYQFNIYQYYKFLNPFVRPKIYHKNLSIEKVSSFDISINDNYTCENTFYNSASKTHIEWILNCPLVNSIAFKIKEEGKTIGLAICYIKTRFKIMKIGRLVHVSFLGKDEKTWSQVIKLINKYFFEMNCYLVLVPASIDIFINALVENGFMKSSRFFKPFYLDNSKNNIPLDNSSEFHLTFLESDLGYRNF